MTAATATPITNGSDLRQASRVLAAVLLPIGPAAVAALRFVLPYTNTDSSAAVVSSINAHRAAESAVVWLGLVATLTIVPAVAFAGRAVARRCPRLATTAVLLLVPGYLCLGWLNVVDAAVLFGVRHGVAPETLAQMYAGMHPAQVVAEGVFVVGHVLGTILLGVGMLRSRLVAAWAAWITIAAQPLHFVAAVIVGSHWLDLIAWGLNTIGFAALAAATLRLPDDEWALAARATNKARATPPWSRRRPDLPPFSRAQAVDSRTLGLLDVASDDRSGR
jgi:hypothetical protein